MKYTNKHDLPPAVFEAMIADNYDPGESDYSVTTCIKSPRMVQLERRHWDDLETDAMDRLWSLLGTAVHNIFEENVEDDAVAEIRMYVDVLGRKIGGQLDHYKNGQISDYKCTSVWSWVFGSRINEWTEQQNIYAKVYRENGYDVQRLRIIAVFRDWKESEFLRNPRKYPPHPLMVINLEVWPDGKVTSYLEGRVQKHVDAENLPDDELPLCTEEEMWAKPTTYAVMKNDGKRASRVLDTPEEAAEYIEQAKAKDKQASVYRIDERLGGRIRCEKYCPAKNFCNQYKAYLEATGSTGDGDETAD